MPLKTEISPEHHGEQLMTQKRKSKKQTEVSGDASLSIPHTMKDGLDPNTIFKIEALAGYGLTQAQVALILNMNANKFQLWLKKDVLAREAMDRGVARKNAKVAETAYKLAVSGDCPAATFFWLKTQCGWRETNHVDLSVRPEVVYRSTVRADGSLIQEVLKEGEVVDAEAAEKA